MCNMEMINMFPKASSVKVLSKLCLSWSIHHLQVPPFNTMLGIKSWNMQMEVGTKFRGQKYINLSAY